MLMTVNNTNALAENRQDGFYVLKLKLPLDGIMFSSGFPLLLLLLLLLRLQFIYLFHLNFMLSCYLCLHPNYGGSRRL